MTAVETATPLDRQDFWERLRVSSRPRLLFVSHGQGGGVSRHIDDLVRAIGPEADVLLLQPAGHDRLRLAAATGDRGEALWFRCDADWDRLVEVLGAVGIDRIHFHHIDRCPPQILELPKRLARPYDVTLHDFYPACPDYHLMGPERFCGGEPDCQRCLDSGASRWSLDVEAWRKRFAPWLENASRVITPSHDTARRIARFFPRIRPVVWPHPEIDLPPPAMQRRVLVPGALGPEKGIELLASCVRDAQERALPLHFRVVGFLSRPLPTWPQAPLSVTGQYTESELPALLMAEGGNVVLFASRCPETYSYTLSAALRTPLPIIVPDLGALPERLVDRANARVIPWDASAAQVNDALLEAASMPAEPPHPFGQPPESYAARYLEGVRRAEHGLVEKPLVIEPDLRQAPPSEPPPTSLAWLYEDGVVCGRLDSRRRLLTTAVEVEAKLNDALSRLAGAWRLIEEKEAERVALERDLSTGRQDLAHARAQIVHLAAETERQRARIHELMAQADREAERAQGLERRVAEMESSRSWRITAPLRAIKRRPAK